MLTIGPQATIEKGTVLIRDGKIAAVGRNVVVPKDARVVDAAGKFVMPGIIDCHSHTAIEGGDQRGLRLGDRRGPNRRCRGPQEHRPLPAAGRWSDLRQCSPRLRQCHWRAERGDQAALGKWPCRARVQGGATRHQVCAGRKSQTLQLPPSWACSLSCHADGCRSHHPGGVS